MSIAPNRARMDSMMRGRVRLATRRLHLGLRCLQEHLADRRQIGELAFPCQVGGLPLLLKLLQRPALTLLAAALIAVGLGLGTLRLDVTTDLRVYFSEDNPQLAALVELEDKYRHEQRKYPC